MMTNSNNMKTLCNGFDLKALKRQLSYLLFACAAGVFANSANATDDPTLAKIERTGEIVIGHRANARPFSFVKEQSEPQGYSIDLCKEIAGTVQSKLGLSELNIKYREIDPSSHVGLVEVGEVDIVCGATTQTFRRMERVGFSILTFVSGSAALLDENSEVRSPSDLDGKRIGVRLDTTTDRATTAGVARRNMTTDIVRYKTHLEGLRALERNEISAYLADRILLIALAEQAAEPEKIRLSDRFFTYEPYALMLRRDALDFGLIVNRTLAELYRTRKIVDIYRKWFEVFGDRLDEFHLRAMYRLQSIPEG
jgi:ABC-type amino acid transport substrate-binding protein